MRKYILISSLIILAFLIQINIFNFLGSFFQYINPILITLVIIFLFSSLKNTVIFALVGGFFLDLYSVLSFGIYSFTLLLMILFIYYFFQKYITNRSFYSFLLISVISTFFFYFIISFVSVLLYNFNMAAYSITINTNYLLFVLGQIILNSFVIAIIYLLLHFLSDRLKTNFIIKDNFHG